MCTGQYHEELRHIIFPLTNKKMTDLFALLHRFSSDEKFKHVQKYDATGCKKEEFLWTFLSRELESYHHHHLEPRGPYGSLLWQSLCVILYHARMCYFREPVIFTV
jgi:hypothetical protein